MTADRGRGSVKDPAFRPAGAGTELCGALGERLLQARRRLHAQAAIQSFGVGAGFGAVAAFIAALWQFDEATRPWLIAGVFLAAATMSFGVAWRRLPGTDALARVADRDLCAQDRLTTAFEIPDDPSVASVALALLDDARNRVDDVDPRRIAPLRLPRYWALSLTLVVTATAVTALYRPPHTAPPAEPDRVAQTGDLEAATKAALLELLREPPAADHRAEATEALTAAMAREFARIADTLDADDAIGRVQLRDELQRLMNHATSLSGDAADGSSSEIAAAGQLARMLSLLEGGPEAVDVVGTGASAGDPTANLAAAPDVADGDAKALPTAPPSGPVRAAGADALPERAEYAAQDVANPCGPSLLDGEDDCVFAMLESAAGLRAGGTLDAVRPPADPALPEDLAGGQSVGAAPESAAGESDRPGHGTQDLGAPLAWTPPPPSDGEVMELHGEDIAGGGHRITLQRPPPSGAAAPGASASAAQGWSRTAEAEVAHRLRSPEQSAVLARYFERNRVSP